MKKTIAIAGDNLFPGDTVYFKKRSWKERLFPWPWHPFTRNKAVKAITSKQIEELARVDEITRNIFKGL